MLSYFFVGKLRSGFYSFRRNTFQFGLRQTDDVADDLRQSVHITSLAEETVFAMLNDAIDALSFGAYHDAAFSHGLHIHQPESLARTHHHKTIGIADHLLRIVSLHLSVENHTVFHAQFFDQMMKVVIFGAAAHNVESVILAFHSFVQRPKGYIHIFQFIEATHKHKAFHTISEIFIDRFNISLGNAGMAKEHGLVVAETFLKTLPESQRTEAPHVYSRHQLFIILRIELLEQAAWTV